MICVLEGRYSHGCVEERVPEGGGSDREGSVSPGSILGLLQMNGGCRMDCGDGASH